MHVKKTTSLIYDLIMKKTLLCLFLLLFGLTANAQVKLGLYRDLTTDDSIALVNIAAYPDSIWPSILTACTRPDLLVKTEVVQKSSSQAFHDLLEPYTQDEQKKIWDLVRYPTALQQISEGGKKSKEELESISLQYPTEIRKTIVECGKKHSDLITQIYQLHKSSNEEFKKNISDSPKEVQNSYTLLTEKPEIVNALSGNMHLAIILGELYKNDSKKTIHLLDSVQKSHAQQSERDLQEWKKGLENNPEAKKEMEQAAQEFAKENYSYNYVDDVYATGGSNGGTPVVQSAAPVINNYYIQPYPYWFGYPGWYDYPYFYPYPYWYHCGFYWGPGGMVFIGFPSPFFMHWYFYHPYHHYYYSYFSDYCLGYNSMHYGPRNNRTGFNGVIHKWARTNEPNLPNGFFNNDPKRPERIKELGRFEMDYHNSTKGVFGKNITRSEFLKNNPQYYPHINPAINQPRFNQPIKYPTPEGPRKFNMGVPGGTPHPAPGGGQPNFSLPKGGSGVRPRR